VGREQGIGDRRPFVVARDENDRHPSIGHLEQRFEGHPHEFRRNLRSKQEIAAVDHEIDLPATRGTEGGAGVGEEIRTATPALDTRTKRKVETEVGVGKEEDADGQWVRGRFSWRWRP
jgi:hypothetical protein